MITLTKIGIMKYRNTVLKTAGLLIGIFGLLIGYFKYGIELPLVIMLTLIAHNFMKHDVKEK